MQGATALAHGLDGLDGTSLLDIKPDRGLVTQLASAQPGDGQIGDA